MDIWWLIKGETNLTLIPHSYLNSLTIHYSEVSPSSLDPPGRLQQPLYGYFSLWISRTLAALNKAPEAPYFIITSDLYKPIILVIIKMH